MRGNPAACSYAPEALSTAPLHMCAYRGHHASTESELGSSMRWIYLPANPTAQSATGFHIPNRTRQNLSTPAASTLGDEQPYPSSTTGSPRRRPCYSCNYDDPCTAGPLQPQSSPNRCLAEPNCCNTSCQHPRWGGGRRWTNELATEPGHPGPTTALVSKRCLHAASMLVLLVLDHSFPLLAPALAPAQSLVLQP